MGENSGKLMGAGLEAGQNVLGMGLGMLTAKWQDKRQLKQAKKLQDLQMAGQKDIGEFNRQQSMKMWKDTNYAAQMEQLDKAGLSAGLMYGGSGAGGSLQGAGSAGSVGGQQAVAAQDLGMAMQMAQIANIKANTEKTEKEGNKIEGEIANLFEDTHLKTLQGVYDSLRNEIQKNTKGVTEEYLNEQLNNLIADTRIKLLQGNYDEDTYENRIEMAYTEMVGMGLENSLKQAGINKSEAEINKMSQDIAIAWKNSGLIESGQQISRRDLDRKDKELEERKHENNLKAYEAEIRALYPGMWNVIGSGLDSIRKLGDKVSRDVTGKEEWYRSPKRKK